MMSKRFHRNKGYIEIMIAKFKQIQLGSFTEIRVILKWGIHKYEKEMRISFTEIRVILKFDHIALESIHLKVSPK